MKTLKILLSEAGIQVLDDMASPCALFGDRAECAKARKFISNEELLQFLQKNNLTNFAFYTKNNEIIRFAAW